MKGKGAAVRHVGADSRIVYNARIVAVLTRQVWVAAFFVGLHAVPAAAVVDVGIGNADAVGKMLELRVSAPVIFRAVRVLFASAGFRQNTSRGILGEMHEAGGACALGDADFNAGHGVAVASLWAM